MCPDVHFRLLTVLIINDHEVVQCEQELLLGFLARKLVDEWISILWYPHISYIMLVQGLIMSV